MLSTCKKDWILPDGRIGFIKDKVYKHLFGNPLSLKGESGLVMWMSKRRYNKHFLNEKTKTRPKTKA